MTRPRYNQTYAHERGETTKRHLPDGAATLVHILELGRAVVRTNYRKNYWVQPSLAANLGVEEPVQASSLLSQEARELHPDRLWVAVGSVLDGLISAYVELDCPRTIPEVRQAALTLAPDIEPIYYGHWRSMYNGNR